MVPQLNGILPAHMAFNKSFIERAKIPRKMNRAAKALLGVVTRNVARANHIHPQF